MKIETHPRDDHQLTLVVEVEPEKLEGARHRAARKIAERAKIPGFRPGKAPYDVVRRLYGDAAITEDAVELIVDEVYPQALKEADVEPAAAGQLENIESLEPPKFVFTVPLMPSVDLGDYRSIRQAYDFQPPSEDDLNEEIENLRFLYGSRETVERPVEEGDLVSVDVTANKVDAAEEEAPLDEHKGHALQIRKDSKYENEWPFPGFSRELIGAKPGESLEITHKFTKKQGGEAFQGQNIKFDVTIKAVRGVNLPALDDEFARKTGLGQNLEEFREHLRQNIEEDANSRYDSQYFDDLIGKVKAGATIKYPPQVLEHEVEHVLSDIESRLQSQGVENLETYFKLVNTDREKFIEEQAKPTAKSMLERGLILDEIARQKKIKIDEKTLEKEFSNTWATLATMDEEFNKRTRGGTRASREMVDAVAMDSANRLMTRRVLDYLKEVATGQVAEEEPAEEKKSTGSKSKTSKKAAAGAEKKPATARKSGVKAKASTTSKAASTKKSAAKTTASTKAASTPKAPKAEKAPAESATEESA